MSNYPSAGYNQPFSNTENQQYIHNAYPNPYYNHNGSQLASISTPTSGYDMSMAAYRFNNSLPNFHVPPPSSMASPLPPYQQWERANYPQSPYTPGQPPTTYGSFSLPSSQPPPITYASHNHRPSQTFHPPQPSQSAPSLVGQHDPNSVPRDHLGSSVQSIGANGYVDPQLSIISAVSDIHSHSTPSSSTRG